MTEKTSFYSRGFHGEVSSLVSSQFPNADFLKTEVHPSCLHYKLVYYAHLITNTLFPNTVIQVVGANMDGDSSTHKIYSLDAHVPSEHADFTNHMSLGKDGKQSLCPCPACAGHRAVHQAGVDLAAKKKAAQLNPYGICLPWDDPSDYCMKDGEVIFFEIDGLNPQVLKGALLNNGHNVHKKEVALHLLQRYEQLTQENEYYILEEQTQD